MLIDIHAHFYTERSPWSNWRDLNARRLAAGAQMGIAVHVASILGTWGARSPIYFPSREDVEHANGAMLELQRAEHGRIVGYCLVNPNYPEHALAELTRRLDDGMVGIKLAASRRANHPLLDPIAAFAAERGVPILHHVWQRRGRDWPGQEASDGAELATLAERHPQTRFILAHLGGGGDWAHTLRAVRDVSNIWVDLSGSGVDPDMMDEALRQLGAGRLLWGADLTLDTGWAKLRYLEASGLPEAEVEKVRYGNARAIFPPHAFHVDH